MSCSSNEEQKLSIDTIFEHDKNSCGIPNSSSTISQGEKSFVLNITHDENSCVEEHSNFSILFKDGSYFKKKVYSRELADILYSDIELRKKTPTDFHSLFNL